jgi:type VI secretion system protein ImpK
MLTRADRFKKLLALEITENKVEVVDGNLLRILNGFPSGSAQLKAEYRPMMQKIAAELANDPARIAVVGHTDASPIFSARFPSNWHLSQARAKNVSDMLATYAPLQERISFEGREAMEPIASNDTEEDRARNRRIDIRIR